MMPKISKKKKRSKNLDKKKAVRKKKSKKSKKSASKKKTKKASKRTARSRTIPKKETKKTRKKITSGKIARSRKKRHIFPVKKFDIPIDDFADIDRVVDWIEMRVLVSGGRFDSAKLQSILAQRNLSLDKLPDIFLCVEERKNIFKQLWPFVYDKPNQSLSPNHEFTKDADKMALYKFFLMFSLEIDISPEHRKLFEICTNNLTEKILSNKKKGFSLGHPRKEPVPQAFDQALKYYAEKTGEKFEQGRPFNPSVKDSGLDSVICRPFKDDRGGNIHLWGQCSTGRNWQEKRYDLNIDRVKQSFPITPKPLDFFSIPFIASDSVIRDTDIGFFLDRPRLLELFTGKIPSLDDIEKCLDQYHLS